MWEVLRRGLFVVALLAFAIGSARAETQQACKPAALATLEMKEDATGRVSVPVTAGGQPLRLIVDTGGSFSILTKSTVVSLGLIQQVTHHAAVRRYGGESSDRYVFVCVFALGSLKPKRTRFFVVPDDELPHGEQGLIGAEFLWSYDLEFDFSNDVFSLYKQNQCPGNAVYWTHDVSDRIPFTTDQDRHIHVPVELDGKNVDALIDTGAPQTVGSLDDILDLFGVDKNEPGLGRVLEDDSGLKVYQLPFKLLTFSGVVVKNPNIALVPNSFSRMRPDERELIIGMNVLRRLHLFVSYGERAMYVTEAEAH